jgi:hypothetical protein
MRERSGKREREKERERERERERKKEKEREISGKRKYSQLCEKLVSRQWH